MSDQPKSTSAGSRGFLGDRPGSLSLRQYALIALFAALMNLPFLGSYHALSEHEVFVAGPALQMVTSGDWLVPRIGDELWLEKPPLPHWMVASSITLFGKATEASVRAPFALAGIGVVVLVASIAARLFGSRIGMLSGVVQAGAQYMVVYSRRCEADMLLLCQFLAAILVFVRGVQLPETARVRQIRRHVVGFWMLVGLMNLTKGLVFGSALAIITCGGWLVATRNGNRAKRFASPIGIGLAGVLACAWPMAIAWREPSALELWNSHLFGRAAGSLGYRQPFYYYALTWPAQLLPWSVTLLYGVAVSMRRAAKYPQSPDGFLWWWFLGQTLLLSLSSGKHHHYLIYALPALSPVVARGVLQTAAVIRGNGTECRRWAALLCLGVFPAACVGGMAAAYRGGPFAIDAIAVATVIAVGALALGASFAKARPRLAWSAALALIVSGNLVAQSIVLPRHDRSRADTEFLAEADLRTPDDALLVATGGCEIARHLFYLPRDVVGIGNPDRIPEEISGGRPYYVISREARRTELERLGVVERLLQSAHTRRENSPQDRFTLFRVDPSKRLAIQAQEDAGGARKH